MAKSISINETEISFFKNSQVLREVGFLSLAAVLLSVGIIWFHNRVLFNDQIYVLYSQVELAGITFMPYLISGAIAGLTALYLLHYIPAEKSKLPSHQIAARIRKLGEGDLVTFTRIYSENQEVNDIARELSFAVAQLNSQMAQMKIINRQQWGLVQEIKVSASKSDSEATLLHIEKIEENWIKTAEIEELIKT